jgi:hypothetical protein
VFKSGASPAGNPQPYSGNLQVYDGRGAICAGRLPPSSTLLEGSPARLLVSEIPWTTPGARAGDLACVGRCTAHTGEPSRTWDSRTSFGCPPRDLPCQESRWRPLQQGGAGGQAAAPSSTAGSNVGNRRGHGKSVCNQSGPAGSETHLRQADGCNQSGPAGSETHLRHDFLCMQMASPSGLQSRRSPPPNLHKQRGGCVRNAMPASFWRRLRNPARLEPRGSSRTRFWSLPQTLACFACLINSLHKKSDAWERKVPWGTSDMPCLLDTHQTESRPMVSIVLGPGWRPRYLFPLC